MIEVPMIEDVRKYQPKVVGPFNSRQIVCILLAAIVAIPIWKLIDMEIDDKILIVLLIVGPIAMCGWIKMDGLPFEKLLIRIIYFKFLTPRKRVYKTENTYKTALIKGQPKKPKKIKVEYSSKLKLYQ